MQVKTRGPIGTLLGLANIDAEVHGVRVRRTGSGRFSSNDVGHGETSLMICYVDGKRSTRKVALARLQQHIVDGEEVVIQGSVDTTRKIILSD